MIVRVLKWVLGTSCGLVLIGVLFVGWDLASYLRSSAHSMRTVVKDKVPIDFELRRARDLVDRIVPELRTNIQVIAQEEVEVAHLRREIEQAEQTVAQCRQQMVRLRDQLATRPVSQTAVSQTAESPAATERLAHVLNRFEQTKAVVTSKQRLLEARERSLAAAHEVLERTRTRKAELEQQIEALVAQHRLVKAQSVGTSIQIDHSQLAHAERLIGDIQKRLDTAQRVLTHETEFFTEGNAVEPIDPAELIARIDEQLARESAGNTVQDSDQPQLAQQGDRPQTAAIGE